MRLIPSLLLPALALSAQPGPPPQEAPIQGLRARRVHRPVKLDGRLGDPAWAEAPPVDTGFTQLWPAYGEPSRLRTEVRVLYDDAYLYIGAHLRVPEGAKGVMRRVHRRDQDSNSDWLAIYLDTPLRSHIEGIGPDGEGGGPLDRRRIAPKRHGSGTNGLFLDGHAAGVTADTIIDINRWDDRDYTPPANN